MYKITRKPQVVAHRGFSGAFPENTRSAILGAIDLGVDMVELDVRLSRDGVPVIFHGQSLFPIANCPFRVHELSVQQLKEVDVGAWRGEAFRGEQILTLDEALTLVHNRMPVNLDIKVAAAIEPVVGRLRQHHMIEEAVLSGCTWSHVFAVRRLEPQLHVLINVDGWLRTLLRLCSSRLALLLSALQVRSARATGLNIAHQVAADKFIRSATSHKLPIWTWTVDEPARALQLVNLGAVSVTSNWPNRILGALQEHAGQPVTATS